MALFIFSGEPPPPLIYYNSEEGENKKNLNLSLESKEYIMNKILGNAFSIQMLDFTDRDEITIKIKKIQKPADLGNYESCVGHQDTANVLGVACNRKSVKIGKGDELVVAQIMGGRLPEGATTLPEGFTMDFFEVEEV